jgi:hypothetical protein
MSPERASMVATVGVLDVQVTALPTRVAPVTSLSVAAADCVPPGTIGETRATPTEATTPGAGGGGGGGGFTGLLLEEQAARTTKRMGV